MAFELRVVDKAKLFTSIIDQIVDGVRVGAFPPGRALPAERVLAAQFGVSRGSVREAIRVLEHAGVLNVRVGSGTYVSEAGVSKAALLRAQAAVAGEQSPLDILVARRAIEPVCAELAATNRQASDMDALGENIREQADLSTRGEDPAEVDLSFHLAVASAAHNPVLLTLVERLIEIMREGTWHQLTRRSRGRPGGAERYLDQHRAIVVAIDTYDPQRAGQAMRQHLYAVEAGLLDEAGLPAEAQ
jgi:GntR family transcriptional regulator, transcriptional repressor for pyruvate dehydrogenase complex